MAFNLPIDPDVPSGADLLSEGDDRIRDLTEALSERLEQVLAGWPDTDPLRIKAESFLSDSLPDAGTPGTIIFANDRSVLLVDDGDEWVPSGIQATAGIYDTMKGIGDKFESRGTATRLFVVRLMGPVLDGGIIPLDLAEFGEGYHTTRAVIVGGSTRWYSPAPYSGLTSFNYRPTSLTQLELRFFTVDDGAALTTGQSVDMTFLLALSRDVIDDEES